MIFLSWQRRLGQQRSRAIGESTYQVYTQRDETRTCTHGKTSARSRDQLPVPPNPKQRVPPWGGWPGNPRPHGGGRGGGRQEHPRTLRWSEVVSRAARRSARGKGSPRCGETKPPLTLGRGYQYHDVPNFFIGRFLPNFGPKCRKLN